MSLDTIRKVWTHPIFKRDHSSNEAQIPVAAERPIRQYAPDGIAYRESRVAVYDFAVHGGAVGAIVLAAPFYNNETVIDGLIVVDVALTSGGAATIGIGGSAGIATGLLKADATAVATYAADATLPLIPLGHGTGEVKATADGFISLTVGTAALTAGKMYIFFDVVFTGV